MADAGFVRGDVGRVDRADRRFHRQAAGERLAALGGVAGHTVTGAGEVFALFDQRMIDVAACTAALPSRARVAITLFMLIAPQA
jgi:hypothetical protein